MSSTRRTLHVGGRGNGHGDGGSEAEASRPSSPTPPALSREADRQAVNPARAFEPVPRLALTPAEAARGLGISEDSFRRHVMPELRTVRRGRLRLVAVAELERWLERSAARGEW